MGDVASNLWAEGLKIMFYLFKHTAVGASFPPFVSLTTGGLLWFSCSGMKSSCRAQAGAGRGVAMGMEWPLEVLSLKPWCPWCHGAHSSRVSHRLHPFPAGSTAWPQNTEGQNPWDLLLSKLSKMKYYHQKLTDNSSSQLQKKHFQGNFIHKDFWETKQVRSFPSDKLHCCYILLLIAFAFL